jgi:hypothetical protein
MPTEMDWLDNLFIRSGCRPGNFGVIDVPKFLRVVDGSNEGPPIDFDPSKHDSDYVLKMAALHHRICADSLHEHSVQQMPNLKWFGQLRYVKCEKVNECKSHISVPIQQFPHAGRAQVFEKRNVLRSVFPRNACGSKQMDLHRGDAG